MICSGCQREFDIRVYPFFCKCGTVTHGVSGQLVTKWKDGPVDAKPRKKAHAQCPHRGEELRRESCATCRGNVQVKVFACSQFGECTISKAVPGVHVCDGGDEENATTTPAGTASQSPVSAGISADRCRQA